MGERHKYLNFSRFSVCFPLLLLILQSLNDPRKILNSSYRNLILRCEPYRNKTLVKKIMLKLTVDRSLVWFVILLLVTSQCAGEPKKEHDSQSSKDKTDKVRRGTYSILSGREYFFRSGESWKIAIKVIVQMRDHA